jgi:hypothetical protein
VLKPAAAKDEFEAKGLRAAPICIHDDSAAIGEPAAVCAMLTRIMQLGRDELGLEYGDEKKLIYQSYDRTADDHQASVAADVETFLPLHEGTVSLVGKVTRTCVRFAGAYIGTLQFVQEALKKAVTNGGWTELEAEAENGAVRKVVPSPDSAQARRHLASSGRRENTGRPSGESTER